MSAKVILALARCKAFFNLRLVFAFTSTILGLENEASGGSLTDDPRRHAHAGGAGPSRSLAVACDIL